MMRAAALLSGLLITSFGCSCNDDKPAMDAGRDARSDARTLDAAKEASVDSATDDTATDAARPSRPPCTVDRAALCGSPCLPLDTQPSPRLRESELEPDAEHVPDPVANLELDPSLFALGVQSGAVAHDRARLWTQSTPASSLRVVVWRPSEMEGRVVIVADRQITTSASGTLHEWITGLQPGTSYDYAFVDEEQNTRSRIGRLRTAPSPGTKPRLRIAATACTGHNNKDLHAKLIPFTTLSRIAEQQVDVLLHLGDMGYVDAATDETSYRSEWVEQALSDSGYQDIFASTSYYATWDDHEVYDNWSNRDLPAAQISAARLVYDDLTTHGRQSTSDPIWTSHQWGDTAEFVVLDTRSERDYATRGTAQATFISDAQMAFVKERLLTSTAHFKLVLTSVPISDLPSSGGWDAPVSLWDRWESFGAQRRELLEFILDNEIQNVWFLTGDVHMGYVGRVSIFPGSRELWEIAVGPAASSYNPFGLDIGEGPYGMEPAFTCNQFAFGHAKTRAETYLELDPGTDSIRVTFINSPTGQVMYDERLRQAPIAAR